MSVVAGNGSTLVFTTSTGFTPKYTQIGGWGYEREALDSSYLGTTGCRTYVPGKLYALSAFTSSFFFEPDQMATSDDCSPDDILFDTGAAAAAETVTITFPISGKTAAASAFITSYQIEDIVLDGLISASIGLQWAAAPTYTDAA